MGRKSTYNTKDAQEIIDRLSKGEPMTHICADDWLPTDRTVRRWIEEDAGFASDIARAREIGHDVIAAGTRQVARGVGESTGDVQRDKLIIDTDLKLLAKWDRRYADKQQIEHSGGFVFQSLPMDDKL